MKSYVELFKIISFIRNYNNSITEAMIMQPKLILRFWRYY